MTTAHRTGAPALPVHEYLTLEDEMGDSTAQSQLMDYLAAVLRWLYRAQGWFVARDLTLYHPAIQNSQQTISPDIAVYKGVVLSTDEQRRACRRKSSLLPYGVPCASTASIPITSPGRNGTLACSCYTGSSAPWPRG